MVGTRAVTGFAVFLCFTVNFSDAFLKCYDTSLTSQNCVAIDLWCIKFLNGSTITRGCANTFEYCTDEDAGCYPEREENGLTQKWCCCNKDLCNSISTSYVFLAVILIALLKFLNL